MCNDYLHIYILPSSAGLLSFIGLCHYISVLTYPVPLTGIGPLPSFLTGVGTTSVSFSFILIWESPINSSVFCRLLLLNHLIFIALASRSVIYFKSITTFIRPTWRTCSELHSLNTVKWNSNPWQWTTDLPIWTVGRKCLYKNTSQICLNYGFANMNIDLRRFFF